jgi:hypothetical protein
LTTDTAGPDTETSDGEFQIFLDLSDMVAGDELQIRVYEKVTSASTQRIVYQSNLVGAQAQPVWVSPKLMLMHGWDVTLDAISGTITVDWSIRKLNTGLTFTVAGQADANIQYVNDVQVTGDGETGTEWGPA